MAPRLLGIQEKSLAMDLTVRMNPQWISLLLVMSLWSPRLVWMCFLDVGENVIVRSRHHFLFLVVIDLGTNVVVVGG